MSLHAADLRGSTAELPSKCLRHVAFFHRKRSHTMTGSALPGILSKFLERYAVILFTLKIPHMKIKLLQILYLAPFI